MKRHLLPLLLLAGATATLPAYQAQAQDKPVLNTAPPVPPRPVVPTAPVPVTPEPAPAPEPGPLSPERCLEPVAGNLVQV